ncbi:hypothetical protein ZIOFF_043669 [Zingiber officinale]|uniref:Uncharacterized protein n=1 Tax=Zingiber officinale TaxID=94328 RepID=A0A8J5FVR3_ZINOF|nr:hypothetical protein ZIOFF_043669 [Zingiber officinale]
MASMTHQLKSSYNTPRNVFFWQDLLGSKDALVKLFKSDHWFLGYSIKKKIQPNLELLREFEWSTWECHRHRGCSIALFVVHPKKFKMLMEMFRSIEWSEGDCVTAFQKSPNLPVRSLKTLQRSMEFLINEAGFASSYIATRPVPLQMNFERRLIPRHRILADQRGGVKRGGGKKPET